MPEKNKKQLFEIRYANPVFETASGGKKYIVGEFGIVDTPTENKRIYPRELMERELNRLRTKIENRSFVGELDHPDDGKPRLSKVSHLVTEVYIDESGVIRGKAEILETDAGKNLYALAKAGVNIGVSLRGYGSTIVNESGYEVVQEDFELLAFDFVADPAAHSYAVLKENRNMFNLNGGVKMDKIQLIEEYNRKLSDAVSIVKKEFEKRLAEEIDRLYTDVINKFETELKTNTEEYNKLINDSVDVAKKAGYIIKLEQILGSNPNKEKYYELIDFDSIKDEDDLVSRVEAIKKEINDKYDINIDAIKNEVKEDEVELLKKENEELKQEIEKLKEENEILLSELETLEQDIVKKADEKSDELNKLKDENEELLTKVEELRSKLDITEAKLNGLRQIAFRSDYAKYERDILECKSKDEIKFIVDRLKDIEEDREFNNRRRKILENFERKSKINEELFARKMLEEGNNVGSPNNISSEGIRELRELGLSIDDIKSMANL